MADVIYSPPEDDPSFPHETHQFGYSFVAGEPVTVTNARHLAVLGGNPFFTVDAETSADEDGDGNSGTKTEPTEEQKRKAFDGGLKAAQNGKERKVPPVYRNAPDSWHAGYDSHQAQ